MTYVTYFEKKNRVAVIGRIRK